MPVDEWTKAQRLFAIARALREGPHSVRQLALLLHLTESVDGPTWPGIERTLQRDLNDLELLEPDFERLPGRPPLYRIRTHRTTLHPVETLALHAAARLMYHRSPGHKHHHLQALERLAQWLPERIRPVLRRSASDVGKRHSREDLALEHAAQAWLEGHPLRFEYLAPGGSGQWRPNELEIYLIEAHPVNLDLYAVGYETSFHRALRTFKLSRMRNLSVLPDRSYTIPDSFDPRSYFESAWGVVGAGGGTPMTVRLRFAPEAAYRVLEGGYPNTEVIMHDRYVIIDVRAATDASGLPRELVPWILSWGPRVEVLEPASVRAHWLRELRDTLARYGGNDG
ncbi:putative DNA-binding transcriptional regulator YafY [Deinobacterium chartae]|uniref:Putative DNA-binding transcriptional regulator YafY n=1 Tax=Deinobacterium chartae TaxID=521158 RepID=A0A841I4Q9_9DEIO|nr:WYL domain-containing protein [Deinobacterium chartae]MBB6100014.1 putative DNA-binding transcriptional regulator YafY [Deinobacterium chartae]